MDKKQVKTFFNNFRYKDISFKVKFLKNLEIEVTGSRDLVDPITKKILPLEATEIFKYNCTDMQLLLALRDWLHIVEKHEADENIIYKESQPFQPHRTKVTLY